MDSRRFDTLARSLTDSGTRRGLLGLFATLPVLGGLVALLDRDEGDAKGRRKRRKKKHKHGRPRSHGTRKKKKCKPKSQAKTCAGKCGQVKNNCKKTVDCGACDCDPACEECFTCQEQGPNTPAQCVVDPEKVGDPCGSDGQVCQEDGACACDATSCRNPTPTCVDGRCVACSASDPCADGCCANDGTCQPGATRGVCGADGESCQVCSNPTPLCEDNACASCVTNAECQAAGAGDLCCQGSCFTGICCVDAECAPSGNVCASNECQCGTGSACSGSTPTCCGAPGACTNTDTDKDNCGSCGAPCSGSTPACWDGDCVCGDVCPDGCQFTSVQAAIDALPAGTTIRICAGAYGGNIVITKNLTLIGAGEGSDPASNTILVGQGIGEVVGVNPGMGTVELRRLRITGGAGSGGSGVVNSGIGGATLRMVDCTVAGNTSTEGFGAGIALGGVAELTRCTIRDNHATDEFGIGGGIFTVGNTTLTDCLIEGNSAGNAGGGIYVGRGVTTLAGSTTVRDNRTDAISTIIGAGGGGIYVEGGALEIAESCRVTENTTPAGYGGGIANETGAVTLQGADPSPIVVANCHENCVGNVPKCAPGGTCPP